MSLHSGRRICENEHLKLVVRFILKKWIDLNLSFDRNLFVCQELINSG